MQVVVYSVDLAKFGYSRLVVLFQYSYQVSIFIYLFVFILIIMQYEVGLLEVDDADAVSISFMEN